MGREVRPALQQIANPLHRSAEGQDNPELLVKHRARRHGLG